MAASPGLIVRIGANLAEFRKNMLEVQSQLETTKQAMSKMANSFDGSRIIADGNAMVKVISDLGGVSKLTEAEQKRVNATVTEALEKYKALGQQAPQALSALAEATRQVEKPTAGFVDQMKAAIPTSGSLLGQVKAMALGYVTGTLALEGFEKAGRAVIDFAADSIKSYTESEDAQRRLVTALRSQGEATPKVIAQFTALAESYQRTTVNSDELIKETESLLVQVGGVLPDQMDGALRATTDLASGLGVDLRTATMLVSKAFEDNFGALKKAGVQIDEARASAEGMTYVLGQIEQRFGGQAQSEAESYAGSIKRVANAWDDVKESIGEYIVTSEPAQVALAAINHLMKQGEQQAKDSAAAYNRYLAGAMERGVNLQGKDFGKDATLPAEAVASVRSYTEALTLAKTHVAALTAEQRANLTAAFDLNVKTEDLQKTFHLTAGEIALFKTQLQESATASKAHASAAEGQIKRWLEEQKQAADETTALLKQQEQEQLDDAKVQLDDWGELVRRHNDEQKQGAEDVTAFLKQQEDDRVADATAQLDDWGELVRRHAEEQKSAEQDVAESFAAANVDIGKSLGDLSQAFAQMAQIGGDSFDGIAREIGSVVAAIHTAETAIGALEQILKRADSSFKGFSASQKSAITAGVAGFETGATVVGATGTRSGAKGALEGAASGAATGALYGGYIGAGVGAIAGAIGGYLSARKAAHALRDANNDASKAIADMQKQLVQQYGSVDQIDRLSKELGVDLIGAWGDQSQAGLKNFSGLAQEFQQRMAALQSAVQDFGLTWRDLSHDKQIEAVGQQADALALQLDMVGRAGYDMGHVVSGAAGQLNDLIGAALSTGVQLPASLEPYIEQLIRAGKLTEDNARAMLGLSANAGPSFDDVKGAADRYGLSLDALGPKVGQLDINEQAKQMSADWETLVSAGADVGAVMDGMKDKAQAVVTEAMKFGDQIPESMKPMLQAMVDAGQLTDDTGAKMTDLSKLSFAEDITKSIGSLVEVLKKMFGIVDTDGPNSFDAWSKSATDAAAKAAGPDGIGKVGAALAGGSGSVKQYLDDGSEEWKIWKQTAVDAAKDAASGVSSQFNNLSFTVPVSYDYGSGPSLPSPDSSASSTDNGGSQSEDDWAASHAALGGLVTDYGIQYRALGGLIAQQQVRYLAAGDMVYPWVPKGTDTVPAMLTPGERVLSVSDTKRYDAHQMGGTVVINVNNPTVRSERDIDMIVRQVFQRLPRHFKAAGF